MADLVPLVAVPERVYDGVEALGVAGGAEYLGWVVVAVVAVAIATVLGGFCFFVLAFHVL